MHENFISAFGSSVLNGSRAASSNPRLLAPMPSSRAWSTEEYSDAQRQPYMSVLPVGSRARVKATVGTPWKPEGFIAMTAGTRHPIFFLAGVPSRLKLAIQENVGTFPANFAKDRTAIMRRWFLRTKELVNEEAAYKVARPLSKDP